MKYKEFAKKLGLETHANELKKALKHKSFCPDKEENSNSRFVFLGMFGFKGKVAEILFNYLAIEGTQLQHYLGNIFKEDILLRIFDKYKLNHYIRYDTNFDYLKHRHIFVFGFLGFLLQNSSVEKLNEFITKNFLSGTEHLIPGNFHNHDVFAQCDYFCRLVYGNTLTTTITKLESDIFEAVAKAGETVLAKASSKSYRFARKKAVELALKALAGKMAEEYEQNPLYLEKQAEREKAESEKKEQIKAEKLTLRAEKLAKKMAERKEEQKISKELVQQREKARRKAKAKAKERLELQKEAEAKQKAALIKMSGKKRRHLEDKKK